MRTLPYISAFAVVVICAAMFILSNEKTSAQVSSEAPLVPPLNTACTVTVQGNTLPYTTISGPNMVSGAGPTISGTLTALTESWVVINSGAQDYWIPRHIVVLLQVPRQ
jgi:hypothetical protein